MQEYDQLTGHLIASNESIYIPISTSHMAIINAVAIPFISALFLQSVILNESDAVEQFAVFHAREAAGLYRKYKPRMPALRLNKIWPTTKAMKNEVCFVFLKEIAPILE